MGGIQVDAEDLVRKLKHREREHVSKTPETEEGVGRLAQTPEEQKIENEKLSSFFANLAKRGVSGSGSPRGTPGREGRAASGKETPSKKV